MINRKHKVRKITRWAALPSALAVLVLGACGGTGSDSVLPIVTLFDDPNGGNVHLGDPLPGLSSADLVAFKDGQNTFAEQEDKADGLGPVFNGVSCAQCHTKGAVGGAGIDLQLTRVTRIGGVRNGKYSDLTDLGGPVLQARSLKEFDPTYPIPGEVVPAGAQFVSHRITTPLFGDGLIEAIPEGAIRARANMHLPDGVQGIVNTELNPITNKVEVGRFGWKAQHSSLAVFAGDAYLN